MIVDIQEKRLGIKPLAQAMLLQTPTPGCIIMAGWTVERWDILSSELSPGNPCSLSQQLWEMVSSNQSALCLHHHGVDSCGLRTGKLGGCTVSQVSMGHFHPRRWGQPGRCSRTRGRRRPLWSESSPAAHPRRSSWTGRAPWHQCSRSPGAGRLRPSFKTLKKTIKWLRFSLF